MRRALVVAIALALAITAATLFLAVGGLAVPATRDLAADLGLATALTLIGAILAGDGSGQVVAVAASAFAALVVALLTVPSVIVAVVGEVAGLRSYVWYAGGAGILTAAIAWLGHPARTPPDAADGKVLTLLFLTGAVAGLVYWAVAGRSTGTGDVAA